MNLELFLNLRSNKLTGTQLIDFYNQLETKPRVLVSEDDVTWKYFNNTEWINTPTGSYKDLSTVATITDKFIDYNYVCFDLLVPQTENSIYAIFRLQDGIILTTMLLKRYS